MRRKDRRFLMGIFAALALPLVAASAAYACQKLAGLHANPGTVAAGAKVEVTGVNYDTNPRSTNVDIRLDSRNGRVLDSIPVTALGSKGDFTRAVTIPAGTASGDHILVATQTLSNGSPCVGCPGRANIRVEGASASAADNGSAAGPSSSSDKQGSNEGSSSSEASQPATQPSSEPAPQPATAQASQSAAAQSSAPAATAAAQPAATASASPAAAVKSSGVAPAPAPVGAAPAMAATNAAVAPEATATAAVESAPVVRTSEPGVSLVPAAAGERSNVLPSLALASALALMLMGVGAFWKSRTTLFGAGNLSPAVG